MKKILCLSLVLVCCMMGWAQDILVTEGGDAIKAWGVEIASSNIYYREAEAQDSPLKSIAKSSVLVWKKADGSRVIISQEEQKPATPAFTKTAVATIPVADASDPEANKAAIARFNERDVIVTREATTKTAKRMLGVFHITPESTMADKNIELVIAPYNNQNYWYVGMGMSVSAKNKTDQTIYIYLGNTFFIRHGTAEPFTQSSASQSAREGQSASASGFSQSVIAVPANSSLDLGHQLFVEPEKVKFGEDFYYTNMGMRSTFTWCRPKTEQLCKLEEQHYTLGETPFDYGFRMTYSFSENNTQLYSLDTKFYLSKIIGENRSAWSGQYEGMDFINKPLLLIFDQGVSRSKR